MNTFLQMLRTLGPGRLAALAGVGIGVLGFIIFLMSRVAAPQMELLYGNLEPADSKRIITQLDQQKIPFELRKDGSEILVPSDMTLKLRVQMAETAMSGGASLGYELFDNQSALGTTSFMQNVNMVRALEGELARTIGAIDNIRQARVHLVLPHREMFSREVQKPSASVILRMRSGKLTKQQVMAIQNLVAAAVPKLEPTSVSIVDDKGTLLARAFGNSQEFMAATADEAKRETEQRLTQSVEELLTRALGPGKIRVEVVAEMDFDRVVINTEKYDPDGQVVRSTVTVSDKSQSQEKEPDPVTVAQNLPDAGLNSGGSRASTNQARTEETVNYEITKKITNQVRESGILKRLSVAVVVDGEYTDPKDQKSYKPRAEAEMEQINALVKSAVGYDANRGDQVEVRNMRFANVDDMLGTAPETIFLGFTKPEIMKMAEGLGVALVAILVILLVVRPLVTRAFEALPAQAEAQRRLLAEQAALAAGPGLKALAPTAEPPPEFEGDELIDIDKVEGRVRASSLKKIGEIVEKHPEEALSIVRNWLYQEGA
ncbi:MAG: flagellar basal-body MS-ring/collar protein FliF [Alphaproteobacteria bacterium]